MGRETELDKEFRLGSTVVMVQIDVHIADCPPGDGPRCGAGAKLAQTSGDQAIATLGASFTTFI